MTFNYFLINVFWHGSQLTVNGNKKKKFLHKKVAFLREQILRGENVKVACVILSCHKVLRVWMPPSEAPATPLGCVNNVPD